MRSIALALSAAAVLLGLVVLWQHTTPVQTSDRVSRDAPLSLWQKPAVRPAEQVNK